MNIDAPNDMLSIYGAVDKRFKNFKSNFSANVNYSRFNTVLDDGGLILNKNTVQRYRGSLETTMKEIPIIELGFEQLISNYNNDALPNQQFITSRPFANIEFGFFKHFILVADYEYNIYRNKNANISSTYDILNAELFFRKDNSPFEFKLTALNILNTKSIREVAFSDVILSTSEYFIQQRYF